MHIVDKIKNQKGQAMMMVIIFMSGAMFTAAAVGGLLTFYQLRQSIDFTSSAMAFAAADAGIEHSLYCYFHYLELDTPPSDGQKECERGRSFSNNASYSSFVEFVVDNDDLVGFIVKSNGKLQIGGRVLAERDLEFFFSMR